MILFADGNALFADASEVHPATYIAVLMSALAMIGTAIQQLFNYLNSREKIRADNALAIETARIAAQSAALQVQVETNTKQLTDCDEAHKKTSEELTDVRAKLAACNANHTATESRLSALEQSVVHVATALTPPSPTAVAVAVSPPQTPRG